MSQINCQFSAGGYQSFHRYDKLQFAVRLPKRAAYCESSNNKQSQQTISKEESAQQFYDQNKLKNKIFAGAMAGVLMLSGVAEARKEGVNKPELLPKEQTSLIDVANFLTPSEESRIKQMVLNLEKDTGIKLRVLGQQYPETPGLAVKDYWGVDGDTVVFVADPGMGNILNFNVGYNVDLQVPKGFWSRLAGRYGTRRYWKNNGEETAIKNAVTAIDHCLREEDGPGKCLTVLDIKDD